MQKPVDRPQELHPFQPLPFTFVTAIPSQNTAFKYVSPIFNQLFPENKPKIRKKTLETQKKNVIIS